MTINVQLLDQTMAYIETHPDEWNQSDYRCETGLCFAGHAAALAGGKWETVDPDDYYGAYLVADEADREWMATQAPGDITYNESRDVAIGGPRIHAADRARRLLGLTGKQADGLFDGYNTLDDLRDEVGLLKQIAAREAATGSEDIR